MYIHIYIHIYIYAHIHRISSTVHVCIHLFDSSIYTFIGLYLSLGLIPDINLTPSTFHLPTHPNYNEVTLICTATLPLLLETDELVFDKVFTWTMNGINVTSNASLPTDLDSIESISTLTQELTNTGDNVFRCEVSVSVPGDPIVSNSSSITITVSGKRGGGRERRREG